MKAVVLFSGGLDSTTLLYWARAQGKEVRALSFDYGQKHRLEIELAGQTCLQLKIPRDILLVDLRPIGGSALTSDSLAIPDPASLEEKKSLSGPPLTYVPFRNGIFLSLAAAWAEARSIQEIICGFHVHDSPEYPDTTEKFVKAMEQAINNGTKAAFGFPPFKIICPFLTLGKADIIRIGLQLGADYSYSLSCYRGAEIPCGRCPACFHRQKAWQEVGEEDHLISRLRREGKI